MKKPYFIRRLVWSCLVVVSSAALGQVPVKDLGLLTGFQDMFLGHLKRGRALVAADFDLDGRVDFYVGNPGDDSFVLRNVPVANSGVRFKLVQTLLVDELAWGALSFDYDNDGDYDLFITNGANEGIGFDHLFRNLWLETGHLRFVDVTDQAGVAGPVPEGSAEPIPIASANAVASDYDRDGDVDIFVNGSIHYRSLPELLGRNILWRNNGDGTFTDVTDEVGLGESRSPTRHSTFLDVDNDGDVDLYENNMELSGYPGGNVLWRNLVAETGIAEFQDVTIEYSNLPGEDLSKPGHSFASAAADFNNDGWEDLLVVQRDPDANSPYPDGHALFLNQAGNGFVNVGSDSGLNSAWQSENGVMGCQVGDVNGDGAPDVYIGNGGPPSGNANKFFVSESTAGAPRFQDRSIAIDFPAPEIGLPLPIYPTYPYRTHGTSFVDVDNDGTLEVAVVNGGPAPMPNQVREPNRLFKLFFRTPARFFKVRPVGNGTSVSLDAIGTRFSLLVSRDGGTPWRVFRTLFAGSCFSAQNGFEVHFGLKNADTIHELRITWPDGFIESIDQGLFVNTSIVVNRQ